MGARDECVTDTFAAASTLKNHILTVRAVECTRP